jgi:hypothetical protein
MPGRATYDWHDEILKESNRRIVECLGEKQAKIVSIEKTARGYRIVELCDGYYGRTLSQEQMERLIEELRQLNKQGRPP